MEQTSQNGEHLRYQSQYICTLNWKKLPINLGRRNGKHILVGLSNLQNENFASMQEVNKKILETVLEGKKASKANNHQTSYPSHSPAPLYPPPNNSLFPIFPPPLPPPLPPTASKLEELSKKIVQLKEPNEEEIIIAPFKEKPVIGKREHVLTYVPWTRTELKKLTKDFPDPF